jgi:hypothetical protein
MASPGIIQQQEIDDVLIRYADTLSPAAISFKLEGLLTPEQVLFRINQLLETPDRFTALQQDQLVTQKMRRLVAQLEEMMNTPGTTTARTAEVLGVQLERLGNRLDRRAASTQKELKTLYAFQGTVLLDGVNASMNYMRTQIAAGKIPKNEQEWDAMLAASIRYAQFEIASHEEGAEQRVSGNPDSESETNEDEVVVAELVELES